MPWTGGEGRGLTDAWQWPVGGLFAVYTDQEATRSGVATRRARFCINDAAVRQPHSACPGVPEPCSLPHALTQLRLAASVCVSMAGRGRVCVVGLNRGRQGTGSAAAECLLLTARRSRCVCCSG